MIENENNPVIRYGYIQILVLVAEYGFKLNMPWWVVWSPFLLVAILVILELVRMVFEK